MKKIFFSSIGRFHFRKKNGGLIKRDRYIQRGGEKRTQFSSGFKNALSAAASLDLLEGVLPLDGLGQLLHGRAAVLPQQAPLVQPRQQGGGQAGQVQEEEVVDAAADVGDGQEGRQGAGEVEDGLALLGLAAGGPGAAPQVGEGGHVRAERLQPLLLLAGPAVRLEDLTGEDFRSLSNGAPLSVQQGHTSLFT